jgi:hypothetical protein
VIYYSSKVAMERPGLYQKFTAMGRVTDEAPHQVAMAPGFHPFRRHVEYFDAKHLDIRPLVPELPFIKNKKSWGYVFRYGFLEIDHSSYEIIAEAMLGSRVHHTLI